jgi:hypothetical protein
MATFKLAPVASVGTSAVAVLAGTASKVNTVIGFSIANTTASSINVSAFIQRSGTSYYLVKNAAVAAGQALIVIGADQKTVLEASDTIFVQSSIASSADVVCSYMQIAA